MALPWPFEPEVTLTVPDSVWRRFADAATSGPVLYAAARGTVHLYAGDSERLLTRPDAAGDRILKHSGASGERTTGRLLDAWLSPSRPRPEQPPDGRRGFCTALLRRATR